MSYRTIERLQRLGLREPRSVGRWWGRLATLVLCWSLGRRSLRVVAAVARIALSAPDDWSSRRAIRALDQHAGDPDFVSYLLYGIRTATERGPFTHRYQLTPAATALLLAPAPQAAYRPRVRLIQYLTVGAGSGPRPEQSRPEEVARWLVDATRDTTDEQAASATAVVLRETDHPVLLSALEAAFSAAVEYQRGPGPRPALWTDDGQPAQLTEILLANPHLPRPPRGDGRHYVAAPEVLLAVLKDRLDLVDECVSRRGPWATVAYLLHGAALPAPPDFVRRCRTALRGLASPAAQEIVCEKAMVVGDVEARAAAVDAGYLPADETAHPIFLFVTEQWDRYDRADPDGELLEAYCATRDSYYGSVRRWVVADLATRHGRPDPCPPPPPRPTRSNTGRRQEAHGSWPTSFGAGDFGGGDFGGGGHVGGFGHF